MSNVFVIDSYSSTNVEMFPSHTFLPLFFSAKLQLLNQGLVLSDFDEMYLFPMAEFVNRVGLTFRSLLFHVARKKGRSIVASIRRNFATHHFAEGPRKLKNSKIAYIKKQFCSNVKQAENTHTFDMFHPIVLRGHFS